MKKQILCITFALALMLMGLELVAWAASSMTRSKTAIGGGGIMLETLYWTANTDSLFTDAHTSWIRGKILMVVTDPDTSAAGVAPADNYDITLKTARNVDIMGGSLGNRDTANTEIAYPIFTSGSTPIVVQPVVDDSVKVSISNIDALSTRGYILIYYQPF